MPAGKEFDSLVNKLLSDPCPSRTDIINVVSLLSDHELRQLYLCIKENLISMSLLPPDEHNKNTE